MNIKTIEEAHDSLPDGKIRQFLSVGVSVESTWDKTSQQNFIERYKAELVQMQAKLKKAEADLAILTLTEQKGWTFFDVSDYVSPVSGSASIYPPFIGTQEEHDRLFNVND